MEKLDRMPGDCLPQPSPKARNELPIHAAPRLTSMVGPPVHPSRGGILDEGRPVLLHLCI